MRRKGVALALAAAALLGLTGCGNFATTEKEVKQQAAFVKTCEDAGGSVFRGFFDNKLKCNLEGESR